MAQPNRPVYRMSVGEEAPDFELEATGEGAGKGGLLVQHAVRSPVHCKLGAIGPALQALINWVELGQKPAGDDVLASDLSTLGSEPE